MISRQGGGGVYNLGNAIAAVFKLIFRHCGLDPQSHSSSRVGKALTFPPQKNAAFTLAEGASHGAVSDSNRKTAFTLAEVLITLGIIGIVAAMTLPTVINHYQKKTVATNVKKAYSELNQVIQMAEAEYGQPSGWSYYEEGNLDKWVETYIVPYLDGAKSRSCKTNERCFGLALPFSLQFQKPGSVNTLIGHYVVLKKGMPIAYAFLRYGGTYEHVTRVKVYVHNPKKYAFVGRDVFTFVFDKVEKHPSFKPYGLGISRENLLAPRGMYAGSCNKGASGSGYWSPGDACSALIMMDGWEIKEDYPW